MLLAQRHASRNQEVGLKIKIFLHKMHVGFFSFDLCFLRQYYAQLQALPCDME